MGRDSVSNHQPHVCLLNRLFRRRSKKTSKLRVTGLCVENSPGTGEFPAQMASYAENVSIWWRHHETVALVRWFHSSGRQCNNMFSYWWNFPLWGLKFLRSCQRGSPPIDSFHKSHNALDKYPIMHHFVTEMCTHMHIAVTKWCIVVYGTVALWNMWDWPMGRPYHDDVMTFKNPSYIADPSERNPVDSPH